MESYSPSFSSLPVIVHLFFILPPVISHPLFHSPVGYWHFSGLRWQNFLIFCCIDSSWKIPLILDLVKAFKIMFFLFLGFFFIFSRTVCKVFFILPYLIVHPLFHSPASGREGDRLTFVLNIFYTKKTIKINVSPAGGD